MWCDAGRGLLRLTVEVPIEEGELIVRALDCAVAAGEVSTDLDPAVAESKARRGARSRPMRSSLWRSRISTVARMRAARPPITTRSSCTPTRNPSAEGPDGPIFRSRQ
jgi:hypothetical protein